MTIIQQLRQLRISQGMSQAVLAKRAGYYVTNISRWENGKHIARESHLADIAQVLGYDIVLRPRP